MKITDEDIREAEVLTRCVADSVERIRECDIPRLWDACQMAGGTRYEAMKTLLRKRKPELVGRFMGCGFASLPNVKSEPRSYVARSVRSTIRDMYDRWLYCLVGLSFHLFREKLREIVSKCRAYYQKHYSDDDAWYYFVVPGITGLLIGLFF